MPTLANQTVLQMALAMYAADATSPCTLLQRQWILTHLQGAWRYRPLSTRERQTLQEPLLAWYRQAHPRTAPLVARQFEERA